MILAITFLVGLCWFSGHLGYQSGLRELSGKKPKALDASIQDKVGLELRKLFTTIQTQTTACVETSSILTRLLTPNEVKGLGIYVGVYGNDLYMAASPYVFALSPYRYEYNQDPKFSIGIMKKGKDLQKNIEMIQSSFQVWEAAIESLGGVALRESHPIEWWEDCLDHLAYLNFKIETEGALVLGTEMKNAAALIEKAAETRWIN